MIITISRESGSGGSEIGHKLADKLGVPCYDKTVTQLTADISGFGTSAEIVLSVFSCPSVFSFFFLFLPLNITIPPNIKARHKTAEIIIKTIFLDFKFNPP